MLLPKQEPKPEELTHNQDVRAKLFPPRRQQKLIFSLNGSDTDWLVYADYLEDNNQDAQHIRQAINEQATHWYATYGIAEPTIGTQNEHPGDVGSLSSLSEDPGTLIGNSVGTTVTNSMFNLVGCGHQGVGVGHNYRTYLQPIYNYELHT